MNLVWSELSLGDRRAIYSYIEAGDPRAAVAVDERIEAAVRQLLEFPECGRPGRVSDTRELVVTRTAYVIPYRVAGDNIRILRVLHGARAWPEALPDES